MGTEVTSGRRLGRTARAYLIAGGLVLACSDSQGPVIGKPLPPTPFVVSSPVPSASSAFSGVGQSGAMVPSVVYISLPPSAIPDGRTATISDPRLGSIVIAEIVDGGFDPVSLAGATGDTLVVTVQTPTGLVLYRSIVAANKPPIVVRTSPPPHKRDVPLNASLVVVFSKPIDPATLTAGAVQLWRNSTPVTGTVQFSDADGIRAEFRPDTLLAGNTDYRFQVTQAITDVSGLPLDSVATVPFTTGTTAPATGLVFKSVSAGSFHSCGVTTSGAAYCWGGNGSGQLGDGTTAPHPTPVAVAGGLTFAALSAGWDYTCGLTTAGALYCWGGGGTYWLTFPGNRPVPFAVGLTFVTLSAGAQHLCGVTPSGSAYCWGDAWYGKLGHGTSPSGAVDGGLTFAMVGTTEIGTCGITTIGAAYCWGDNSAGELGTGSTIGPEQCLAYDPYDITTLQYSPCSTVPVSVAGRLTFGLVSESGTSPCGLTSSGDAYCWGDNRYGQLGNGTTTGADTCFDPGFHCTANPVAVAGGLTFTALYGGRVYSCGLTSTGATYCWGANTYGVFGDGTTTGSSTPVAAAGGLTFATLSADEDHICGVTAGGVAYCWGQNSYGDLGDGTSRDRSVPVKVAGQR